MSDNSATTNECRSCQLFLRVGIPVVAVCIIIVIASIVWFDRYDKHRLQKKLQEKRVKKLQSQKDQEKKSSKDNSCDSISNGETDLSIYTLPSGSIVNSTELQSGRSRKDNGNDLDNMERGRTDSSKSPKATTKAAVVVPSYQVQRLHALIQQVHDETVKHLQNINEELVDDDVAMNDSDDQSSIESDATPVAANNNNNSSSTSQQQATDSETPTVPHLTTTTFIVQLPPTKDMVMMTHADIGLIRNNLSIPGTTESESASSSSSTSSSSNCRSNSDVHAHGTYHITA